MASADPAAQAEPSHAAAAHLEACVSGITALLTNEAVKTSWFSSSKPSAMRQRHLLLPGDATVGQARRCFGQPLSGEASAMLLAQSEGSSSEASQASRPSAPVADDTLLSQVSHRCRVELSFAAPAVDNAQSGLLGLIFTPSAPSDAAEEERSTFVPSAEGADVRLLAGMPGKEGFSISGPAGRAVGRRAEDVGEEAAAEPRVQRDLGMRRTFRAFKEVWATYWPDE
eukprot:TRINITY_DN38145_c0_g1_i1.p1 TRINITY_DN38145_c0_g1~~TRINITY_DN38145_c0_g1_i1.p1  ORF type:complete len:227 (-),score=44.02 TRINITY_DN38145_c0_g1_i1:160-840(-)